MQDDQEIESMLLGVQFKIWGSVGLPEKTDYRYEFKPDTLIVWLNEPKPFDYEMVYGIENEIKLISFVNLVHTDNPFSIELTGFHVKERGFTGHIELSIPAFIRQPDKPKRLYDLSGNQVFDYEQIEKDKISIADEFLAANKNGKPLSYLIDCFCGGRKDTRKEFEYYYEVIDYFKSKYKTDVEICEHLQIDRERWGRFFKVLNISKYFQSKHRGLTSGGVEWAPQEDIWFARNMMTEIIIKYLRCD